MRPFNPSPPSTQIERAGSRYELPWGHPEGWPGIPDGSSGALRGQNLSGLRANNDCEAIQAWFQTKAAKSRNTLLSYRKEVTRLLLWAGSRNQALSDLHAEDLLEFRAFLRDPQPATRWISTGKRYGIADPRWRPFAGGLTESSVNQSLTILHDLFRFLSDANYLALNPLALLDRRVPNPGDHAGRRHNLSQLQWKAVRTAVNDLRNPENANGDARLRAQWLFTLLYLLGPRISDFLGTFAQIQPETVGGERLWIWSLVGKGNKPARLPLNEEMVRAMRAMRQSFKRTPLPSPRDPLPLVPRLFGRIDEPLKRSGLHEIIKGVIVEAADWLEVHGEPTEAITLRQASAHWLRHTAASETIDSGADLVVTAELMRHSDIRTTHGYTHKDIRQLLSVIRNRKTGWGN